MYFLIGCIFGSCHKIRLNELTSFYYTTIFRLLHSTGRCIELLDSFSFPFEYLDVEKTVFCFKVEDIQKVLELRSRCAEAAGAYTHGEVDPWSHEMDVAFKYPHPSLQEMLLWVGRGSIDVVCFDFDNLPNSLDYSLPYTFISHMHGEHKDKLGPDVRKSFRIMADAVVWMDLFSMCQKDITSGYSYEKHSMPVVEMLDVIMKKATRAFITLNPTPTAHHKYDPLQIKHKFDHLKIFVDIIIQILRDFPDLQQSHHDILQMEECIIKLSRDWFPTNEYFGRLWCYVERLAMNPDCIFVFEEIVLKFNFLNIFD